MKRILYILPDLHCGGAERVSLTLMRTLKQKDYDILFVNLCGEEGAMTEWMDADEQIVSLHGTRSLCAVLRLYRFIRKTQPDYLFATHQHTGIIALLLSYVLPVKVVVRIPNMPSNRLYKGINGLKEHTLWAMGRLLYRRAEYIIVQTKEMEQEMCDRFHLDSNKVVVIPNPVDSERVQTLANAISSPYSPDEIPFVAVGNTSLAKGHDILIKSMERVYAQHPSATLHILGRLEGEWGQKIRAMAQGKKYVHLHGFIANPYPYILHSRALVLSSRMEGYPNVVLEAMTLQKPVVATRCVPVLNSLIREGENGYLVPIEDVQSLAEAMQKALDLPAIRNNVANQARTSLLQVFI